MATQWVNVESIGSYFESLSTHDMHAIVSISWWTSS